MELFIVGQAVCLQFKLESNKKIVCLAAIIEAAAIRREIDGST